MPRLKLPPIGELDTKCTRTLDVSHIQCEILALKALAPTQAVTLLSFVEACVLAEGAMTE